jgi:pterin-4a-carbinolamine dehydratase
MKRVSEIMSDYFEDSPKARSTNVLLERSLPVKTKEAVWAYVKDPFTCLEASFQFESADTYAFFISEVAELEKKMSHHGLLECMYPTVSIKVRTHDLDMVTKQDIRYSEKVFQIFKDAKKLEELS